MVINSLALCAILALASGAGAHLNIKEEPLPCHRLPLNVQPKDYQLELSFGALDSAAPFQGLVNITLDFVRGTAKRFWGTKRSDQRQQLEQLFDMRGLADVECPLEIATNEIVLHAAPQLAIESVQLVSWPEFRDSKRCCWPPNDKRKEVRVARVVRDPVNEMLSIRLASSVPVGSRGWLAIGFGGKMSPSIMRGVYVSHHKDRAGDFKHIVSNFQPTGARRVFPAFDEPRFKTPFKLTLNYPKNLRAFANSEPVKSTLDGTATGKLARTEFQWTPKMAPHMVAFTVGQYGEPLELVTHSALTGEPYKVRLITAPGLRESAHFALMVAKESLEYFERYINYAFPLDKLDIVAIADLERDNTESWGLAFVRDSLVWIDDETKQDTRITTAVNVAHVCVHQWFANLVTPAWWSELWITEGVSAQFAFNIVRELYPQLQSEYFVRLATLSGVMQLDSRTPAAQRRPLAPDASQLMTSAEIEPIFDQLTFMKSASLMQMLANYLGPDVYKSALSRLVHTRAHETIELDDLVQSIRLASADHDSELARRMLTSWTKLRGVPVLELSLNETGGRVCVRVRVADAPTGSELLIYTNAWYSSRGQGGIQLLQLDSGANQEDTCLAWPSWFSPHPKASFFKLSLDPDISTYFRSSYSPELLAKLKQPIGQANSLSAMDRLQIIDDAHALVQSRLMSSDEFQQLASWYENETNGAVLLAMLEASKTLSGSPFEGPFMRVYREFGFTASGRESALEQRSREAILTALVERDVQQVVTDALDAFDEFVNDEEGELALFLRAPVYSAVVRAGSKEQVSRLFGRLETSQSEEERGRIANAFAQLR